MQGYNMENYSNVYELYYARVLDTFGLTASDAVRINISSIIALRILSWQVRLSTSIPQEFFFKIPAVVKVIKEFYSCLWNLYVYYTVCYWARWFQSTYLHTVYLRAFFNIILPHIIIIYTTILPLYDCSCVCVRFEVVIGDGCLRCNAVWICR